MEGKVADLLWEMCEALWADLAETPLVSPMDQPRLRKQLPWETSACKWAQSPRQTWNCLRSTDSKECCPFEDGLGNGSLQRGQGGQGGQGEWENEF